MGKILQKIATPAVDRSEIVEWEGSAYTVCGRPDANLLGRTLLLTEDQRNTKAKHFSALTGVEFDAAIVPQVELVAACLQHEDDPDQRYDVSEIAKLATVDGLLLMHLAAAAAKCLGIEAGPAEAIAEAAAGE